MRNLFFNLYHLFDFCNSLDYSIFPITTEEKVKLTTPCSSETGWIIYTRDIFQCNKCKKIYHGKWKIKEEYDYGGIKK